MQPESIFARAMKKRPTWKGPLIALLLLLFTGTASGQYVRTLCSTLSLSATTKATCFDYTAFKLYYWNGSTWIESTGGSGSSFSTKTPDEVTGLTGWWEADAITGLNDGDPVTTWPDQASVAHNFTQSTAGNKPLFKTNIANGLPAVRFDDTDDGMDSTLVTANPYTVMIIFNNRSFPTSDNQRVVQGKTVNAFIGISNGFGTTLGLDIFNGTAALTKSHLRWIDQSFSIVTYTQAANDQRAYVNGQVVSGATTASPSAWGANGISFGATGQEASQPANSDVLVMAIWNNVISPEDRLAVEYHFRLKYSLSQ